MKRRNRETLFPPSPFPTPPLRKLVHSSMKEYTRARSAKTPFGHVTFANIWDLWRRNEKRVVSVPWDTGRRGRGEDGTERDKSEQSEQRDYTVANRSRARAREETSGSNQFMRDRFWRER